MVSTPEGIKSVFQGQEDEYQLLLETERVLTELARGVIGLSKATQFFKDLDQGSRDFLNSPDPRGFHFGGKPLTAALRREIEEKIKKEQI